MWRGLWCWWLCCAVPLALLLFHSLWPPLVSPHFCSLPCSASPAALGWAGLAQAVSSPSSSSCLTLQLCSGPSLSLRCCPQALPPVPVRLWGNVPVLPMSLFLQWHCQGILLGSAASVLPSQALFCPSPAESPLNCSRKVLWAGLGWELGQGRGHRVGAELPQQEPGQG